MFDAQGNVGGLVFRQQEDLVAARDAGRAGHDDPVFGAVVVHLQRQAGAGGHADALDLEAFAAVDGVIAAPGAVHQAVGGGFGALGGVEAGDNAPHVLDLVAGGHQQGVGGLDDHGVVQAQQRDQAMAGIGIDIAAVFGDDVAAQGIALAVLRRQLP